MRQLRKPVRLKLSPAILKRLFRLPNYLLGCINKTVVFVKEYPRQLYKLVGLELYKIEANSYKIKVKVVSKKATNKSSRLLQSHLGFNQYLITSQFGDQGFDYSIEYYFASNKTDLLPPDNEPENRFKEFLQEPTIKEDKDLKKWGGNDWHLCELGPKLTKGKIWQQISESEQNIKKLEFKENIYAALEVTYESVDAPVEHETAEFSLKERADGYSPRLIVYQENSFVELLKSLEKGTYIGVDDSGIFVKFITFEEIAPKDATGTREHQYKLYKILKNSSYKYDKDQNIFTKAV